VQPSRHNCSPDTRRHFRYYVILWLSKSVHKETQLKNLGSCLVRREANRSIWPRHGPIRALIRLNTPGFSIQSHLSLTVLDSSSAIVFSLPGRCSADRNIFRSRLHSHSDCEWVPCLCKLLQLHCLTAAVCWCWIPASQNTGLVVLLLTILSYHTQNRGGSRIFGKRGLTWGSNLFPSMLSMVKLGGYMVNCNLGAFPHITLLRYSSSACGSSRLRQSHA